ncbi:hypothetical protein [Amycolatopsis sp. NPDC004378]
MTSPASTRRRLHTSDRLFIAAILAGAMLVPHLVLSIVGDWPAQPFNAHLLVVLLLVGGGWRAELGRAATEPEPDETVDSFDAITRQLREFRGNGDGTA